MTFQAILRPRDPEVLHDRLPVPSTNLYARKGTSPGKRYSTNLSSTHHTSVEVTGRPSHSGASTCAIRTRSIKVSYLRTLDNRCACPWAMRRSEICTFQAMARFRVSHRGSLCIRRSRSEVKRHGQYGTDCSVLTFSESSGRQVCKGHSC